MKLCANISLLFTETALPDRFSAARAEGFSAVEIQFPYTENLAELKDKQLESNLDIALINLPVGDLMEGGLGLASSPKHIDEFKRAVDICLPYAQGLDVDCVNVLAGRCPSPERRRHSMDIFLRNLEYCAEHLEAIGVKAVFEAVNTFDMPDFLINRTDHMQQVIHDLNHRNVAMQYDLYHMARMGEAIEEQLPDIISSIGHIQFADTPNRHQPGTGDLPFEQIFNRLKELQYEHWIGAEYKPLGHTADSLGWMPMLTGEGASHRTA